MDRNTLEKGIEIFYPALLLDRVLSRHARKAVEEAFTVTALIFFLISVAGSIDVPSFISMPRELFSVFHFLTVWQPAFFGAFCIALSVSGLFFVFTAFYDSYYFSTLSTVLQETSFSTTKNLLTFEAAEVVLEALPHSDLTRAFIYSQLGARTFSRLGIKGEDLYGFLSTRVHVVPLTDFRFAQKNDADAVGFGDVAEAIVATDAEFFKFLSLHSVTARDFAGSASWAERR
ncbi:MAG: hypothetical protein NUV54_00690, partial [Candidatus Taylorbacteria bacterium]|nr:hypothetical protein [Candidatus Taylorbacteria bacterium]